MNPEAEFHVAYNSSLTDMFLRAFMLSEYGVVF
jgi:hypothetical protein